MPIQTFRVSPEDAGRSLAEVVRIRFKLSWSAARRLIDVGRVHLGGNRCQEPSRRVKSGQRVQVNVGEVPSRARKPQRTATARPETKGRSSPAPAAKRRAIPGVVVRHADAHVVVVEKPIGLTTMRHSHEAAEFGKRAQRYLPSTLAELLPALLPDQSGRLRAVHRLDRDTSGLVVFARTAAAEGHLGKQFRAHSVERRYLALVRGLARDARIESYLVRDRGDGRRGSSVEPGNGQRAVTHVRVVEVRGDFTLVECRLETGRTHQVRIHLGESGTPICGERIYDRPLHSAPLPDKSGVKRLALHAASLGFDHPTTGKRMSWQSPLPADLAKWFAKLPKR